MKALLLAVCAVAGLQATAAPASSGAPGSATCQRALDALREREDRVLAAPRERADEPRRQMLQARRAAALACLGETGNGPAPQPSRIEPSRGSNGLPLTLQTIPSSGPAPLPPTPAVPPPPLPRTLAACDANGCWTSDGVRLQRVGPQLLGPGGFCSTAGTQVRCP